MCIYSLSETETFKVTDEWGNGITHLDWDFDGETTKSLRKAWEEGKIATFIHKQLVCEEKGRKRTERLETVKILFTPVEIKTRVMTKEKFEFGLGEFF